MTNPSLGNARAAGGGIPLRPLTAWALLVLAGLVILFGFLAWIIPVSRMDQLAQFSLGQFTSLPVLVAPLLAVLVAGRVGPALRQAPLIGLVALVEYATALLLGSLAFLFSIAGRFDDLGTGIYAFGAALQRLGGILGTLLQLGLLALAGLWTYQIFTGLGGRLPQLHVRP